MNIEQKDILPNLTSDKHLSDVWKTPEQEKNDINIIKDYEKKYEAKNNIEKKVDKELLAMSQEEKKVSKSEHVDVQKNEIAQKFLNPDIDPERIKNTYTAANKASSYTDELAKITWMSWLKESV